MAAPPVTNNANTMDHQQTTTNDVADSHHHVHHLQGQHGNRPNVATIDENGTSFQVPVLFGPPLKQMGGETPVQQIQAVQRQQPKQPEFVVFELFGQQKQEQQQTHQIFNVQQQQKLPANWAPFSPLNSSPMTATMFNNTDQQQQQQKKPSQWNAESAVAASASNGVCFATVHLWPDHRSSMGNTSSSDVVVSRHRSQQQRTSRLMFDNPMFRRLPNWHFFGDDRRLMQIPPLIPLLPAMPIERTLLYIAPNESSSRQLIMLAMLDMKRKSEIMGHVPAIGGDNGGGADGSLLLSAPTQAAATVGPTTGEATTELLHHQHQQQEDDLLLLPPTEPECPSSTSGVESMSSAEESSSSSAMTERSSRSTTPTNKRGRNTPAEERMGEPNHPQDGDEQSGNDGEEEEEADEEESTDQQHNHHRHSQQQEEESPASSATESCTSSTPNSPPTFDRRIVRMSRGTRDAVRRLSRRFEEEREEEEAAGNGCATAVDTNAENGFAKLTKMSTDEHEQQLDRVLKNPNARRPLDRTKQTTARRINADEDDAQMEKISLMDPLSERIRDFHYNEDQSHAQLNHKLQLRDQLYYAISPIFPMCGLYIVGSSLNGFGTKRSDLDLCLMITNRDIDQRTDAVVVLSSVMRTLESNQIVSEQNLILAKVPILRIKFVGTFHDITVDLNVNNSVAIRNTHLMCYYSSFDWRVRPLVMVVKEWAKRHGINDSACSSFTSYSLVLMVIHYLQCGAQPPVLPNLQQMYPKRFSVRADVRTLNVSLPFEPIPTAMGWQFKDDATLSELLLGFLRYYAFQFDFDADAISIRMGTKVNRAQVAQNQSPFNTLSQWHCICIEEPFTLSNAAHSVYDERIFQDIKKAFVDSYRELDKHRDLDRFLGTPVTNPGK